jgi:hypothetical protein
MKKRILTLAAVLALVAVLVAPMAALADEVNIGGTVPSVASVTTMTVPGPTIGDGNWALDSLSGGSALQVGTNYAKAPSGNMLFTQGNDGATGWGVTVQVRSDYINPTSTLAQMATATVWLPTPIEFSNDNGTNYYPFGAATQFNYSGTTSGITPLDLIAKQKVNTTDKAGVYWIVVVYTLTVTH